LCSSLWERGPSPGGGAEARTPIILECVYLKDIRSALDAG
jgi:hypothetical protein